MKEDAQLSIHISIPKQQLILKRGGRALRKFSVSTSKYGAGSEEGSMRTPLGRFRIAEKIGAGRALNTAFKSRKPVRLTKKMLSEDDLIMSRILWLDGLERANANSHDRYIYIHGTNHEETIGRPDSHGCIRMKNADVAELFDLVKVETPIVITGSRRKGPARKRREKHCADEAPCLNDGSNLLGKGAKL
ncbi:MAG: L,D-transpeptidase [Verrucomicrobiota bacterium]|nr:L,D-transpeptidase [Verrucomicrobiota bacterium]MDQ6939644.1 L,D-transpeptidase [Verrucomicrobiota bacterium]